MGRGECRDREVVTPARVAAPWWGNTGGGITRRLIYPKGAYILHMIRMMMHDNRDGDKLFKETMQDFVNTYRGKAATTEEFKAIVEKHMSADMDAEGNRKMDWFFNEYV